MVNRNRWLVVAVAALVALDVTAASAQDTTRTRTRPTSTRRIPITKEAPAPPPRVDTVTVYRTDTLQLPPRVDTIIKTNTITRVDTVTPPPPRIRQIGGLYAGIAGGASFPAPNFNNSDHPGWRIEGLIGVDPVGSWIGARLRASYAAYSTHDFFSPFVDDANIMSFGGDVKLRAVAINPFSKRVQIYGLLGGDYNRFRNIVEEDDAGVLTVGDGPPIAPPGAVVVDDDWHSGWGWSAGAGVEMGWGATNVFLESRFARFSGVNSDISHVPLQLGVSWFF